MKDEIQIKPDNYSNWFALYHLANNIGDRKSLHISSTEFGEILDVSQQTASRRFNDLEVMGWIERKITGTDHIVRITKKGADVLLEMYKSLKEILENILIVGEVTSGLKEGAYYVSIKGYFEQFKEKLEFTPYKGTLNLKLSELNYALLRENIKNRIPIVIEGFKDQQSERRYGDVECYECYLSRLDNQERKLKAAILDIERTHHKENIVEILAEPYLRDYFNLKDGDRLRIELNNKRKSN
ncbi:MAG: CTP-dependent riboflavin kinase [Promethearchaeota archaeon]|nr:MAG: CTP-dependent riboflavin kinase [Candidatus Lokiarchaeota archaeon]